MAPLLDPAFIRKLDRLSLLTRRSMVGELQGERRSPRRGSSVEFADFRPYSPGDDIRQIDWNLYARMERFFLKLFVAEEEVTVHLLVDTSQSMQWGDPNKLAYAIRLVAAFGYIVLSGSDKVTVTTLGEQARVLPGVRGKRGAFPMFTFLENLTASGAVNIATTCQRYTSMARTPGPLLLCSDLLDPHWKEALRVLVARGFEVTLLHVLAPQEISPQLEGDIRLVDSEGGASVELTADLATLQRYHATVTAWRSEVEAYCAGRGIVYLFVNTAMPLEEVVLSELHERKIVHY
jgi:uncharacterized protein (DUF58 family)